MNGGIGLDRLSLNQATVKHLSLAEAVALCVRHTDDNLIPAVTAEQEAGGATAERRRNRIGPVTLGDLDRLHDQLHDVFADLVLQQAPVLFPNSAIPDGEHQVIAVFVVGEPSYGHGRPVFLRGQGSCGCVRLKAHRLCSR